ncbi:MAG: HU family DNA-binding protein [Pseudomonadota bacterium]
MLTLKHFAADLAEAHDMPKRQTEDLLAEFIDSIGANLKKGKKVRIVGLGILEVRKRAARMGRNPATGESIRIKASKKVAFRAAKDLKERVL